MSSKPPDKAIGRGLGVDGTERDCSRAQLAYLLPLLDHTEDAIIAVDAGWHIVAWNKGAERMYGWTAEDALTQPATFARVDWHDVDSSERLRQLAEHGRWRGTGTAERKDGSKVSIETVTVAIRGGHGEITGYLGIHRDITERERAEERLRYHASLLDNIEDGVIATDAEDFRITAWNRGAERLYGFTAEEVLGRPAREVATFPGDVARRKLEAELLQTGRTRIELEARHKDGSSIEVELIAVAVKDERSEITGYLGIHRDIGERRRTEHQLELRIGQQAAVAQLGLKALGDGGLQPLMDEAAATVCRELGVEYAKVDELLPEGKGLLVRAGAGWDEGIIGSCVMPAGRGSPAGHALKYGQPVIVENMRTEARFEVPGVLHEHDVISDVTVVIDPRGTPFGTLAALSTRPRRFAEHDIDFVQSVANVLASAIERAKEGERLEAAREADRGRIARELHDDALRELTDALALAAMARSGAATPREEQRWLDLSQALERAARQLRAAVSDLRLSPAEARAFTDLLEELVATQADLAVGCKIELHGRGALPAASLGDRGAEVLRIVREAITNARIHSGATMIEVDGRESHGDLIRIKISDDGEWPGRERAVSERVGTGIIGMFDRAGQIGAELRIQGRRRGGTSVSLEVPCEV